MEKIIQIINNILHILAAVTWIGSMIYSQFAMAPSLRPLGAYKAHAVNGLAMKNFSGLSWTSLLVLLATGTYSVIGMWDELSPLTSTTTGIILLVKLFLVAALVSIFFLQFYLYGPRMKKLVNPAMPKNQENTLRMSRLSQMTQNLSSIHLYTGLAIVIAGVILSQLLEK